MATTATTWPANDFGKLGNSSRTEFIWKSSGNSGKLPGKNQVSDMVWCTGAGASYERLAWYSAAMEPAKPVPAPASSDPHTPTLKVVLLGDSGVGKTCLRSQLVHHIFSGAYKATIGADFLTTTLWVQPEDSGAAELSDSSAVGSDTHDSGASPKKVCLQVWDTAGQERFNSISQAFYRGADVAVLVYDVTNYESLLSVREWFARFMAHCKVSAPAIVVVGNKLDKAERSVELAEVHDILCRKTNSYAESLDGHVDWHHDLMEASAKDLASVEAVFQRAACLGCSRARHDSSSTNDEVIDLSGLPRSSSCAC